jgi:hypothetical protein
LPLKLAASYQKNILTEYLILNTALFADDQVIVAVTEDKMQSALYALCSIAVKYTVV